jgi:hypothetical protein
MRYVLAIVLLASSALLPQVQAISHAAPEIPQSSQPESRHSIVFVIDVSSSMYDIIDNLREALKAYVRECRPGDSISIVTFGSSSQLFYRRTIRTDSDKERLLKFCDQLTCPDQYTYIPCGLRSGVAELHNFFQKDPTGVHMLVLLSDGRNNPPRDVDKDSIITYEAIRERYLSRFEPGKDWYITYVALKGLPDLELRDFVQECRGNTLELHKELFAWIISEAGIRPLVKLNGDNRVNLGNACLPAQVKIPLSVYPLRGMPEGKAIAIEVILTDIMAGTRLLTEVRPSKITCGSEPMKIEIELSLKGTWDQDIIGALVFKPLERAIFIVTPSQISFRLNRPPRLLVGRYSPALDHNYDPIDWLALGPLEPGGVCGEKLALQLEGSVPIEDLDIRALTDIDLPDGVRCDTEVMLGGLLEQKAYISVTAKAEEDAPLLDNTEFTGNLVLLSPSIPLLFLQESIPLKIFTPKTEITSTLRERSYWAVMREHWKLIGLAVLVLVAIILLIQLLRYLRRKRLVLLEGWLVVLEKPTGFEIENIQLKELSEKKQKSTLILGSHPSSDIVLDHESIDKRHARLRSGKAGAPTPVYISGLALSDVKVNKTFIDKEVVLNDRDTVEIGAFQFLYSNSHLKQVVVHYKDGDIMHGVPLTWNIEEKGFVLGPADRSAKEIQAYIPFRDLKAVFFVKDFDKEIARKMKHSRIFAEKDHVIVNFQDGEKIEGYTVKSYDPKSRRFFIVPKPESGEEENNICILVERGATKEVSVLEKEA